MGGEDSWVGFLLVPLWSLEKVSFHFFHWASFLLACLPFTLLRILASFQDLLELALSL